jgi:tetratricopeptide (TPR) repeat protein
MSIKKSILAISASLVCVYANVANTQEYKDGVVAFNEKNYIKSEQIFQKLFEQDSANTQVNFYLGRIYYEKGMFERALSAFDRVLIMDETHARTKLELGRTYIALNMLKDAKKIFGEVLNSNAPKAVKDNVKKVLATIEKYDSRSKFNFLLSGTIGYDDNVQSYAGDQAFRDLYPNLDLTSTSGKKIGSIFTQEIVNVRNNYDFGRRNGWFLDSSFLLFNQNYKIHTSDILLANMTVGPTYQAKDYKISIPFTYDRINYGHDQLMHSIYVQPKLDMPINKSLLLSAYGKYQKKMYFASTNRDKNARVKEASGSLTYLLNKTNSIQGGYTVSREDRVRGTATHVDKLTHSLSLAYMTTLFDYNLKAQATYKKVNYFELYNTGTVNRDDRNYSYLLSASKQLNKSLSLSLTYNNMKSFSNYKIVEYNKNVTSLALNYMF